MPFPTRSPTVPPITWTCPQRPRRSGPPARRGWRRSNWPDDLIEEEAGRSDSVRPRESGDPFFWVPAFAERKKIWRLLRLRNELDVHIRLQAFDAAFGTVARFLDAAERRLGRRNCHAVHAHHAGLQRVADRRGILLGACKRVGSETELQRVRALDHFVEGLEGHDWRNWPERFFGHDLGVVRQVGDDGWLIEEALVAVTRAAGNDLAAAILGIVDEAFHCVEPARIGERAQRYAFLEAVAQFQTLGVLGEAGQELAVVLLVHVEPCRRDADLAGVAILERRDGIRGFLGVGI